MKIIKIGSIFYVRKKINGKDTKISLRTSDYNLALLRSHAIENKTQSKIMDWIVQDFKLVNGLFKQINKRNLQNHKLILKRFQDFCSLKNIHFSNDITSEITCQYRDALANDNFALTTVRTHLMILSSIMRSNHVKTTFTRNDCPIHSKSTEKGVLSQEDTNNCIELAKRQGKAELSMIFQIAYYTGMRLSDIALLKKDEINHFSISKTLLKNKSKIFIPVHKNLRASVNLLLKTKGEFLFSSASKSYLKYSSSKLSRQLNSIISTVIGNRIDKLPHRKRAFSRISFHSIRHGFVLNLIKQQIPIIVINKMTGMSTDLIIKRYGNHFAQKEINTFYNQAMEEK